MEGLLTVARLCITNLYLVLEEKTASATPYAGEKKQVEIGSRVEMKIMVRFLSVMSFNLVTQV